MYSAPTNHPTQEQEKKTFQTPKGTLLPLMNIKGKQYLQVAHRIVWFREEHPNWQVVTEAMEVNVELKYAIFRAKILDEHGNIIATSTKAESIKGFADYIEKSETGAIGRALALCGYGTQFAPEFDEGDRLADTPTRAGIKKAESDYEEQVGNSAFVPKVLENL